MLIIQIALAIVLAYIIIISLPILIALIAGIIVIIVLIVIVSKILNVLPGKYLGPSQKEECDEKWRIWEEQREKEKTQKRQEEQEELARKEKFAVSTPGPLMEQRQEQITKQKPQEDRKAKEQRQKWLTKQKFQDNMKNKVESVDGKIMGDPSEAMQNFFKYEDEFNKNNKTEI